MNPMLKIVLFIVVLLAVMLIIQSYLFVRRVKAEGELTGSTLVLTFLLITARSPRGTKRVVYYLEIITGLYLLGYSRIVKNRRAMSDLEHAYMEMTSTNNLHVTVIQELVYPFIILPFAKSCESTQEFNSLTKELVGRLESDKQSASEPVFLASLKQRLAKLSADNNVSLDCTVAIVVDYLSNLDPAFVKQTIKENKLDRHHDDDRPRS